MYAPLNPILGYAGIYLFFLFLIQNEDGWYSLEAPVPTINVFNEFFLYIFLIQFYVPFQDYFSSYETGQSVGGAKTGEPREKTPDTRASRTWLDSHIARAGLEPTPDTAVK